MLGSIFGSRSVCDGIGKQVLPPAEVLAFAEARRPNWRHCRRRPKATKRLMKGKQLAAIKAKMQEEGQLFSKLLVSKEAKEAFTASLRNVNRFHQVQVKLSFQRLQH